MRLLVFNAGSSSLKFDLVELRGGEPTQRLAAGAFADRGDGWLRPEPPPGAPMTPAVPPRLPAPPQAGPLRTLAEAAGLVLAWLDDATLHGRSLLTGLDATVHRIVHGGEAFRAPTRLGEAELETLTALGALAPLHNPPALSVIQAVRGRLGTSLPIVGVFDTAYYARLPEAAWRYAVPRRWHEAFGVRRYGFHGTAHRYLVRAGRARASAGRALRRVVSLQLGRGCSVTATLDENAIATSMGFTPLEGLVMGTRSGDLDPGALLHVMERAGLSPAEMRHELNSGSGLLGLSGSTADMRELLALQERGDARAALAVEVFCRRARHYVGAYASELGGLDLIVFGGGIGENCPQIRERILQGLEWAGIGVDRDANLAAAGIEASIAAPGSRAAIEVIRVDEATILAAEAAALLARGSGV